MQSLLAPRIKNYLDSLHAGQLKILYLYKLTKSSGNDAKPNNFHSPDRDAQSPESDRSQTLFW